MTIIITCTRTEPQNKRKHENINTAILQQLEIVNSESTQQKLFNIDFKMIKRPHSNYILG